MPILVTAATGSVGRHIVDGLSKVGVMVRAVTRDLERAADLFARENLSTAGVEFVEADMGEHRAVLRAATGCAQAYIASADSPHQVEQEVQAARAALDAGATHVIKLSSCDAAPDAPYAWARHHAEIEAQIATMTPNFTFLRPHFFMQNLFSFTDELKQSSTISVPAADGRLGMIDARDIAAAAVKLLLDAAPLRRIVELTGPHPASYAEVAAAISSATDQKIRYENISEGAYLRTLTDEQKVAPDDAADIIRLYRDVRRGMFDTRTGEVEALTGNPPRSIGQFAQDYARRFS